MLSFKAAFGPTLIAVCYCVAFYCLRFRGGHEQQMQLIHIELTFYSQSAKLRIFITFKRLKGHFEMNNTKLFDSYYSLYLFVTRLMQLLVNLCRLSLKSYFFLQSNVCVDKSSISLTKRTEDRHRE